MEGQWYRFRIHFHGPGGFCETYKYYAENPSEECLRDDRMEWADETSTDDGHYGCHSSHEAVGTPPLEWLKEKMSRYRDRIIGDYSQLMMLRRQIKELIGDGSDRDEFKRRMDEIPVLPKKEIPENGYRAIYDWVLTNVHPDSLVDGTKTTSELVIEILEKTVR